MIDHYDGSKIGKSIYDLNYIKRDFTGDLYVNNGTYSSKEGKNSDVEYEFQETYKNNAGEKMQATGRFVGSLGVAVVIEEFYSDAWKAWRQVLMLSTIGIAMFALLSIFLVKNTISLTYISNELLKRKKHTEVIVSNLINGIIQYDSDFRVLLINPMAESMLGVKREDIIGKQINTNLLNVDPKYESLVKVLYPALSDDVRRIPSENGKPKVFEIKITKPLEMELQVTTISIHDRSGIVNGYVKVLRDISREKAISKTKSEFISVAAHQLRTPLSAIKWIFKMLMDGDVGALSKEQKEFLQKGYDSNERIIQLVGDMLNVARIEEGRFGYEFYYVDVIELIKKNIKTMGLKAEEKNIKLEFEGPKDEIKPIKIDPARIELVIQNLLDNALKYTQKNGNISVKIEKADNSFVKISVKDSGVGIPKDQRERLFTKFFRGSNVIKMQTEGTGLGLFITRNIVKRHGGDIRVESESGSGTTFSFTLPLDESLIPSKESDMSDAISL
ncbi:PAS domain-containing protein [Candidatus Azambacteria bacterium]|nr:PAS domain-containing protein [Candidatus Azambacteria bacterium]